jgi:hypothetical protein
MKGEAKQIVFRYNDLDKDTDVEVDILGDLPHYTVGEIIVRRGKSWKVTKVLREGSIVGSRPLPVYIVTVADEV